MGRSLAGLVATTASRLRSVGCGRLGSPSDSRAKELGKGLCAQDLHLGGASGTRGAALADTERGRPACNRVGRPKACLQGARHMPLSRTPARCNPPRRRQPCGSGVVRQHPRNHAFAVLTSRPCPRKKRTPE
eukprot:2617078-Prymnesium_polylepis.1